MRQLQEALSQAFAAYSSAVAAASSRSSSSPSSGSSSASASASARLPRFEETDTTARRVFEAATAVRQARELCNDSSFLDDCSAASTYVAAFMPTVERLGSCIDNLERITSVAHSVRSAGPPSGPERAALSADLLDTAGSLVALAGALSGVRAQVLEAGMSPAPRPVSGAAARVGQSLERLMNDAFFQIVRDEGNPFAHLQALFNAPDASEEHEQDEEGDEDEDGEGGESVHDNPLAQVFADMFSSALGEMARGEMGDRAEARRPRRERATASAPQQPPPTREARAERRTRRAPPAPDVDDKAKGPANKRKRGG